MCIGHFVDSRPVHIGDAFKGLKELISSRQREHEATAMMAHCSVDLVDINIRT